MRCWRYEPRVSGKTRRPDYLVRACREILCFDLKTFNRTTQGDKIGGPSDPYRPIREKIKQLSKQFSQFKECCCGVLYDAGTRSAHLRGPGIVMAAMLGDIGLEYCVDWQTGQTTTANPVMGFTNRGKMIDYKRMEPQNTTIAALLVLERFPLGQRTVAVKAGRMERELGRNFTDIEFDSFLRASAHDIERTALRISVYENPYARRPLPRHFFMGPYDQRFGPDGGQITRVFVGDQLATLERDEHEFGLDLGPFALLITKTKPPADVSETQ